MVTLKRKKGGEAWEVGKMGLQYFLFFLSFFLLILKKNFFNCLFRATPVAYGGSQARRPIRATAASLRHSHSNARSEPCLRPMPQLTAMPDP